MRRHVYNLSDEVREETRHPNPTNFHISYRERVRLSHLDVVKSLDKEFGHRSVWDDDDGVWVNV